MQFGRHICSGAYANGRKCMYTGTSGNTVDCSKFVCGVYTDIIVSCAHEVIGICVIYVTFEGIFVIAYICGNSMIRKGCSFLGLLYAVKLGPYADYSSNALGHICVMWQVYLFKGICQ